MALMILGDSKSPLTPALSPTKRRGEGAKTSLRRRIATKCLRSAALPRLFRGLVVLFVIAVAISAVAQSTRPVEGLREAPPRVFALVGANVVTAAGVEPRALTIVIRDGVIADVGADIEPPADAQVVDLAGKTVYPGFIDAFSEARVDRSAVSGGAAHWNDTITPQVDVTDSYSPNAALNKSLRGQGIAVRLVAPQGGIIKGTSAIVTTGDESPENSVVKSHTAMHARLTVPFSRSRDQYPNSPMGAVALARQTMLDTQWYADAQQAHATDPQAPRPEHNTALAALAPYVRDKQLMLFDANNELFALRADQFAREFGLNAGLVGSGYEYRRLDAIAGLARTIIVPVDFPMPPNVSTVENARHVTLEQLMHWRLAPDNLARMESANVPFAVTSSRLSDRGKFLANLREAIERGLSKQAALAALTSVPAQLLGIDDQAGTIAVGKTAHLVVADGDLFVKKTKVLQMWVDGKRFDIQSPALFDLDGVWQLRLSRTLGDSRSWQLELSGSNSKPTGKIHPPDKESVATSNETDDEAEDEKPKKIDLKRLAISDGRLTASISGKEIGETGTAMLSLVIVTQRKGDSADLVLQGQLQLPQKKPIVVTGRRSEPKDDESEDERADEDQVESNNDGEQADGEKADDDEGESETATLEVPVNYPLGAYGRSTPPEQPEWIVFQNAQVWTAGAQGVIENAVVVVQHGRIHAIGVAGSIELPDGAKPIQIDCEGKHISPGIIDCHSHMATDGGVNESSQAITAEVRIGDFIDSDDITIYRQLAGGVTASNILHGSANPIGGQNQVIKLRWGALPEEMKMHQAPAGIKFALGENVKQSNWGNQYTTRYPQTRMGVEQIIRDAFHAAKEYDQRWQAWRKEHRGLPPRRDLELEALAEIVRGERWIHCHSYRQDEILALLRTLEDFDITIGSLQHILEGYKVAPEMAKHGATGSSFSDWWAYKFEVFDAIPHNGALMYEAGITVSFNSDDRELGRHLNHEAAKAVKYGGVPKEEALKFVTLNAAKQLRIDQFTGSLEAGKDADLVVWSGPPLSLYSRCEQTWIDGRKYFDIDDDRDQRETVADLRNKLIQAILDSGEQMAKPGEEQVDEADLWPRDDLFCAAHDHDGHLHGFRHAVEVEAE